jgi:hypothetical protein
VQYEEILPPLVRAPSLKNFNIEKHRIGHCYTCVLEKSILLGFGTKFPGEIQLEKYISSSTSSSLPPYCIAVFDHVIINYSAFILGLLVLPDEMHVF